MQTWRFLRWYGVASIRCNIEISCSTVAGLSILLWKFMDLGYVHTAPFSNLSVFVGIQHPFTLLHFCTNNGEKNIRFYAFTLLTKTDKNLPVFVIYDRSHCSVFVKLHKGAEAVTLISALKLLLLTVRLGKLTKLNVFYLIAFCFLQIQHWILREICEIFCCCCCSVLFLSVFVRSHWSTQRFQKLPFLWISTLKSVFENLCVFVGSSVNGFTKTGIFCSFCTKTEQCERGIRFNSINMTCYSYVPVGI